MTGKNQRRTSSHAKSTSASHRVVSTRSSRKSPARSRRTTSRTSASRLHASRTLKSTRKPRPIKVAMPVAASLESSLLDTPDLTLRSKCLAAPRTPLFAHAREFALSALFFISIVALIFSSYKIITYILDSAKTSTEVAALERYKNSSDSSEKQGSENNCSADEISEKVSPLSPDFDALKGENPDTVAWLEIPDTSISYPVVQTLDNQFYLAHSFDGTASRAGWVFLDYRSSPELTSRNNIIYAHGRLDGTMFGPLRTLLDDSWFDEPDHHYIYTATTDSRDTWEIFSIYLIPTTSDYLEVDFTSDFDFLDFLELIESRSEYDFAPELSLEDHILTLSTCYDNELKLVVHARRI